VVAGPAAPVPIPFRRPSAGTKENPRNFYVGESVDRERPPRPLVHTRILPSPLAKGFEHHLGY